MLVVEREEKDSERDEKSSGRGLRCWPMGVEESDGTEWASLVRFRG